jgi:CubicO group peptidase (beta-lactamase class C family)
VRLLGKAVRGVGVASDPVQHHNVEVMRTTSRAAFLRLVAAPAALALFGEIASGHAAAPPATYPGKTWAHVDNPQAAGFSRAGLQRLRERIARTPTTGLMVVHGGRVVFEYGDVRTPHLIASMRKSVLSMMYGQHVAHGTVRLESTLSELGIDDIGGLSAEERKATVRDLLTARSGVYHEAQNQGDSFKYAPPRGSKKHGEFFLYNNWDFNALGTIFERRTGRGIYAEFDEQLAQPLQMQDFELTAQRMGGDPRRSMHPAYHFRLSTRDMARIGYLMLRHGEWAGRQLIPRDWVAESTRVVTPLHQLNPPAMRKGAWGYGYLWWVWDGKAAVGDYRGAYLAHGLAGQHLAILPKPDLVVAHTTSKAGGANVSHGEFREILDQLLKARCGRFGC